MAEGNNDDAFQSLKSEHSVAKSDDQQGLLSSVANSDDQQGLLSIVVKPEGSKSQSSDEWDRLWSSQNTSDNRPGNKSISNRNTLNNSESEQSNSERNIVTRTHETSRESKCASEVDNFSLPLQLEVTPPGGIDDKSENQSNFNSAKRVSFKRYFIVSF